MSNDIDTCILVAAAHGFEASAEAAAWEHKMLKFFARLFFPTVVLLGAALVVISVLLSRW